MKKVNIKKASLAVLLAAVGVLGVGKSTFADGYFSKTEGTTTSYCYGSAASCEGYTAMAEGDTPASGCSAVIKNTEQYTACLAGQTGSKTDLQGTVKTILQVVIGVVGLLAVVMIIYGGIQYTTSAGDTGKVTKAKNTILYGIVGLVVALLAFAIVTFVLGNI